MNKRVLATLAAAMSATAILATAPPATAEPNPPGCEKGYFCIYSGESATGRLVHKSSGNWSGSVTGLSIFNNGRPQPGYDHIQFDWRWKNGGGGSSTCLHYNPGPGAYINTFGDEVVFTKVAWRGEC
ncbi:hypothetical protein [Streptomyces sp. NPDC047097]|uniref:hypothetical protein n=1 Tax=Streptomyces sp. NPDC047097 TaxID=3155260 RepID=UPI0033EAD604